MIDVDVLLLDLDGTVLDFVTSQREALRETVTRLGVKWVDEHFDTYDRINLALWEAYERREITAADLRLTRWRRYLEALAIEADPGLVGDHYLGSFAAGAHLIDGAADAVAALADHVTLVAVTNGFSDVQHDRLARSGIDRYLAGTVVSDEVGAAKPDPRIFDAAFEIAGNPPRERVAIVGDSLTSDMAGGRAYGIQTIWINPMGADPSPHPSPDVTIATLSDLVWPSP